MSRNIRRLEFEGVEIIRYYLGSDEYIFRIPSMELDVDSLEEAQAIIKHNKGPT